MTKNYSWLIISFKVLNIVMNIKIFQNAISGILRWSVSNTAFDLVLWSHMLCSHDSNVNWRKHNRKVIGFDFVYSTRSSFENLKLPFVPKIIAITSLSISWGRLKPSFLYLNENNVKWIKELRSESAFLHFSFAYSTEIKTEWQAKLLQRLKLMFWNPRRWRLLCPWVNCNLGNLSQAPY